MANLDLEFIETMIIKPCNISCQGCTTFSDLKWSGYVTWEQGRHWIEPWLDRINIHAWGLMGGEPLMNADLRAWLVGIRKLLPGAQIRLTTNGLLLSRNKWIIDLMHKLGNSTLKISRHLHDDILDQTIKDIMTSFDWEPVYEFGINRWKTSREFRFQVAQPTTFYKTFQGTYENMSPHNSDPKAAFDLCIQKKCPMLLDGKLYKCGTAALTAGVLERFGWPNQGLWAPYLNTGIAPDCTDNELLQFVKNFGRPHTMCRQCPTANDSSSILDHTITVKKK